MDHLKIRSPKSVLLTLVHFLHIAHSLITQSSVMAHYHLVH